METAEEYVAALSKALHQDFHLTWSHFDEETAILYLNVSYQVNPPLEYITVTIDLPEGMVVTDSEIEELMKEYDEQS